MEQLPERHERREREDTDCAEQSAAPRLGRERGSAQPAVEAALDFVGDVLELRMVGEANPAGAVVHQVSGVSLPARSMATTAGARSFGSVLSSR